MTAKDMCYHWSLVSLAARTAELSVMQIAQPITSTIDNRML
jgi:hypothetical protein